MFWFFSFLNLLVWVGLILILEHMQRIKNLNLRSVSVFFSFSAGIINDFWHLPCFIVGEACGRAVFSSLLGRETIQWQNYMTGFYFCGSNFKAVSSTFMCFSYLKS